MTTVLIDFSAGNLHSAEKAFRRMARETDAGEVLISDRAEDVRRADRVVLPGDGAFPACAEALRERGDLHEALIEAVERRGTPFLGICVGMQLMATRGREYRTTPGFGWIPGEVVRIEPGPGLKVPHMGWNDLVIDRPHPVLDGIADGRSRLFRPFLPDAGRDPLPPPRLVRVWRRSDRNRRPGHDRRHTVPPGEEPADGAQADRQLPALATLTDGLTRRSCREPPGQRRPVIDANPIVARQIPKTRSQGREAVPVQLRP